MKIKHKKVLQLAKGYRGRASTCYAVARNRVEKALQHAYVGRKLKKRDMRTQWIRQINSAARLHQWSYSGFQAALPVSDIALNRPALASLAVTEPYAFKAVLETARAMAATLRQHTPHAGRQVRFNRRLARYEQVKSRADSRASALSAEPERE